MSRLSPLNDGRIDRTAFAEHFAGAVDAAVAFAATIVRQRLPSSRRFLIEPNASFDDNPLRDDEQLSPDDSLPRRKFVGPFTAEEAVGWMWRDGKVPEWVDVSLYRADRQQTFVSLVCCGRFTGLERRLYYRRPGDLPPFGIKSPVLPPFWRSVHLDGRFDLPGQWQPRLRRFVRRTLWRPVHWTRRRLGGAGRAPGAAT